MTTMTTMMWNALYCAIYEENTVFQYVHFTEHGLIRGGFSCWKPELVNYL